MKRILVLLVVLALIASVANADYICGNGIKEPGEDCDGTDLGRKDCEDLDLGYDAGTLLCRPDCTYNHDQCIGIGESPDGGNNQEEEEEAGAPLPKPKEKTTGEINQEGSSTGDGELDGPVSEGKGLALPNLSELTEEEAKNLALLAGIILIVVIVGVFLYFLKRELTREKD